MMWLPEKDDGWDRLYTVAAVPLRAAADRQSLLVEGVLSGQSVRMQPDRPWGFLYHEMVLTLSKPVFSIFWYAAHKPAYSPSSGADLRVFPWKVQIIFGLAWLNYAMTQHDIFIYLQTIPALVTAVTFTLQWHPYLRKRVRRTHETFVIVALSVLLIGTVATSVSPYMNAQVAQYALGAIAGLATLGQAGANLAEVWRFCFYATEDNARPPMFDFVLAFVGLLYGGAWTAYGFYGANDYFISIPFAVLALHSVIHLLLLGYAAFRSGGLETGWDSQSEAEEDDMTVDRLNRANTRSSYAGSIRSMPRSTKSYGNGIANGRPVGVIPEAVEEVHEDGPQERYPSDEEMGGGFAVSK
ncbi:hypothetical protein HK101_010758 [Irineochytrium annulatum]|nr:hypothetical protein HK101_010758 [Irineochytrium annulatum]